MAQEQINQLTKKKEGMALKVQEESTKAQQQKKLMDAALSKVDEASEAAEKIAPERIQSER